jgi:hypothetical protein
MLAHSAARLSNRQRSKLNSLLSNLHDAICLQLIVGPVYAMYQSLMLGNELCKRREPIVHWNRTMLTVTGGLVLMQCLIQRPEMRHSQPKQYEH